VGGARNVSEGRTSVDSGRSLDVSCPPKRTLGVPLIQNSCTAERRRGQSPIGLLIASRASARRTAKAAHSQRRLGRGREATVATTREPFAAPAMALNSRFRLCPGPAPTVQVRAFDAVCR